MFRDEPGGNSSPAIKTFTPSSFVNELKHPRHVWVFRRCAKILLPTTSPHYCIDVMLMNHGLDVTYRTTHHLMYLLPVCWLH